ncbi:MAG: 3-deoxy-manno-octulosonate cytidylyltransferase [Gammaproteobacteria bacterium]|nr:3-deoxy-manno-octulosonate cytidylyltransferase [Gammaproteobacteria bacterium]
MSFNVVIPARYDSQRLPGKPLKDIHGKTLIQRVYEQARASDAQNVIVATDDERIASHVRSFGGRVTMTSAHHVSGTDRVFEVCRLEDMPADAIVVNVQGDEPLIPPAVINQVAENLVLHQVAAATLGESFVTDRDLFNPGIVKAVHDATGRAIYFSRAPVPWIRDHYPQDSTQLKTLGEMDRVDRDGSVLRHLGIYAYRVSLLSNFVQWDEAPLERLEKLEQLRILWNGASIHIEAACQSFPQGVDTQEDLERVRAWLKNP